MFRQPDWRIYVNIDNKAAVILIKNVSEPF